MTGFFNVDFDLIQIKIARIFFCAEFDLNQIKMFQNIPTYTDESRRKFDLIQIKFTSGFFFRNLI